MISDKFPKNLKVTHPIIFIVAATEVYSHKKEDKKAAKKREKLFHVTEATHSLKLFVQKILRLNSMVVA